MISSARGIRGLIGRWRRRCVDVDVGVVYISAKNCDMQLPDLPACLSFTDKGLGRLTCDSGVALPMSRKAPELEP